MDQDIEIKALPLENQRCRFTVNQAILPGRTAYFGDAERAKGSPLAEALFALPEVSAVTISGDTITVTRDDYGEWPALARQIGVAIRAQLQSGAPLIAEAALAGVAGEEDIRTRVQALLEREINPAVGSHGGWVELLGVQGNDVFLQLGGGCQGCGMADVTLKQGIETLLRQEIPELGQVFDQTDHAAGRNPYYTASKK